MTKGSENTCGGSARQVSCQCHIKLGILGTYEYVLWHITEHAAQDETCLPRASMYIMHVMHTLGTVHFAARLCCSICSIGSGQCFVVMIMKLPKL